MEGELISFDDGVTSSTTPCVMEPPALSALELLATVAAARTPLLPACASPYLSARESLSTTGVSGQQAPTACLMPSQPAPPVQSARASSDQGSSKSAQQSEQLYLTQPPRLRMFSGEEGDIESFSEEAERVLRNCPMEDGAATEWILQALTGCARQEVLRRPNLCTANDIIITLKETFGGDHRGTSTLLGTFHRRSQGVTEGIIEYAQHLQLLAQRANRRKEGCLDDEALRDQFVTGLHSPLLRRDLRRYHPPFNSLSSQEHPCHNIIMKWNHDVQLSLQGAPSNLPLMRL